VEPWDLGKQNVNDAGLPFGKCRASDAPVDGYGTQGCGIDGTTGEDARIDTGGVPSTLVVAAQIFLLNSELLSEACNMAAFLLDEAGHGSGET